MPAEPHHLSEVPKPVLRINLQSTPAARAVLGHRCEDALSDLLRASEPDQLAVLKDTRRLHRSLFGDLAPDHLPEVAGTYRGTLDSPLQSARRAVFLSRRAPGLRYRDICCPPQDVGAAMTGLSHRIEAVWLARPEGDAAFGAMADISHDFFRIHPFVDGNGHVYRIMMALIGPRFGLLPKKTWRLHPRPYDHQMSLCLQWYPDYPELLACYLRKWFT